MNNDDDVYVSISDLRKMLKSVDSTQRKRLTECIEKATKRSIIIPNDDLTNAKVRGFKLDGRFYAADAHIDVFRKILQIISNEFPGEEDRLLSIRGRKNKYFSRQFDDLRIPELISGTDIYYEANENAKSLQVRCEKVLKLYDFDYLSFEIDFYR